MNFTINGHTWDVVYVPPDSRNLLRSDGSITLGVTDLGEHKVYINNQLDNIMLRKVLIHEICHACMFSYGIIIDINTEELICDFVASHGEEIIKNADYIFEFLKKFF